MCEKCTKIKKQFPEYKCCPYCGEMYRPEKIVEAAKIIQTYCYNVESCSICPFSDSEASCIFTQDSPNYWRP